MLVTDRQACGDRRLEDVVEAAVEGGVNVVQLREKDLPAADLYDLALRLRQIVGTQALLLVNDRVDVALAAGSPRRGAWRQLRCRPRSPASSRRTC